MPSLKEVRNRIDSVQSTQQITNAMKMVAASKLRRAQDAILRLRPYAGKLNEIIANISQTLETATDNPYGVREEPSKRVLIVAISSNKGLCGAFNANVIKQVSHLAHGTFKNELSTGKLDIICIGKKGWEALQRKDLPVIEEYNDLFTKLTYARVEKLCNQILDDYLEGTWGRVIIVYNQFKNAAVQHVTAEDFLPVQGSLQQEGNPFGVEYLYEPARETILRDLIPTSLRIQFFKTILDSFASEHGARMTAMHKATDNAGEMLKELRLTYNKARQASITREIIEIVSGAEALKG
ncbi:MAG TPA: ATP synthase F1 subunit gamma [Bacteroidales bacterium]|nr:ATP synthase F1 subunit gamma [Bacteroidales bacterium]HRZ47972.1 ATP synthase F1 subunit gamma [Bacteroidales bacterium]